jgi:hypothetical protein
MRDRRSKLNYEDATFNLLFKDDLQERELAKILLEFGTKGGMIQSWLQNTFSRTW